MVAFVFCLIIVRLLICLLTHLLTYSVEAFHHTMDQVVNSGQRHRVSKKLVSGLRSHPHHQVDDQIRLVGLVFLAGLPAVMEQSGAAPIASTENLLSAEATGLTACRLS